MSLPSSALVPVSGVDWPMTIVFALTPGTCWACALTAMKARTANAMRNTGLLLRAATIVPLDLSQGPLVVPSRTIRFTQNYKRESEHGLGHRNRTGSQD